MRARLVVLLATVALAVGGGTAAVVATSTATDTGAATAANAAAAPEVRHEPGQAMLAQRVSDGVPPGAYQRALAQAEALPLAHPRATSGARQRRILPRCECPTRWRR